MSEPPPPFSAKQTLLGILLSMLGTVGVLRLYLHLVRVQHIYPGGVLLHHLFIGALLLIPAAFVLAFRPQRRWVAAVALLALGSGSGMVLDEVTFLVLTKASDADYTSAVSWEGSLVLVTLAVIGLGVIYRSARK